LLIRSVFSGLVACCNVSLSVYTARHLLTRLFVHVSGWQFCLCFAVFHSLTITCLLYFCNMTAQHPDPAQNLTKSCRPSQLSTHKISSKSVHNFFRYPAKIQKSGVSCFLDPDYDPDPAQNLINSSRPPQLLTRIILWKFVHNLLRYTTKIPKSSVNPFPGSRV